MIANQKIMEAVSRLTGVPADELRSGRAPALTLAHSLDPFDWAELAVELENEFDQETVRWAVRYAEALVESRETRRAGVRLRSGGRDPLWDRELDG